jgi:hypothetical protein
MGVQLANPHRKTSAKTGKKMNRSKCLEIVKKIEDLAAIRAELVTIATGEKKRGTWAYYAEKLLAWIDGGMTGKPPFSVFRANGNKKLPFFAFSSLAIADCPGKGACVKYCYSLKAWRYPAAFFRQLQNSLLMRHNPAAIAAAWGEIPAGKTVRLFVDGDFNTVETLKFFMNLCKERADLSVYGYSKSWLEFVTLGASGFDWPKNYLVNKSNGSRWVNTGIGNAFSALPIVRGEFDAVTVSKSFIASRAYQGKDKPGSAEYRAEVREKLRTVYPRAFACPGSCGNCLPGGRHACGSKDFAGVAIGIGVHA